MRHLILYLQPNLVHCASIYSPRYSRSRRTGFRVWGAGFYTTSHCLLRGKRVITRSGQYNINYIFSLSGRTRARLLRSAPPMHTLRFDVLAEAIRVSNRPGLKWASRCNRMPKMQHPLSQFCLQQRVLLLPTLYQTPRKPSIDALCIRFKSCRPDHHSLRASHPIATRYRGPFPLKARKAERLSEELAKEPVAGLVAISRISRAALFRYL